MKRVLFNIYPVSKSNSLYVHSFFCYLFTIQICQGNLQEFVGSFGELLLFERHKQIIVTAITTATMGNAIARTILVLFLVLPENRCHELDMTVCSISQ
jgi:hypothetical protein